VRQAVAYALNRASYIPAIYNGGAELAKNPLPPVEWAYAEGTAELEYNPDKARALLKKAGYGKGFEAELWTLPVARPYNPNGRKMGELMQADLAKVGIRLRLVTYDWLTYVAKARRGEHQMIQLGWSAESGDPDGLLRALLSCASVRTGENLARWCHRPYDRLVVKARTTGDIAGRTQLYVKAQKVFRRQLPWIPLVLAGLYRGMDKNLEGYRIDPLGLEDFYPLDLK
jgi:dipeptide transport system substrate-binding protein